ncbi:Endoribonuclease L-PSP [Cellulomonas flavigena DSM 20109]|uniref:Endoribonuclease L-PSP n=1 Tax=Cellulomonas flavigena (strain ATCC 482 / DSM 20109 / BCRC 11376 / JCM 18109 / NBRC 3775 / NCIMB 8073 / NRS 134) TaxID=446466 RepID=D5UHQ7_CELFN|nr:Endoribonuclease L-PSP [Cellulomonas flavigena DSM 20109]
MIRPSEDDDDRRPVDVELSIAVHRSMGRDAGRELRLAPDERPGEVDPPWTRRELEAAVSHMSREVGRVALEPGASVGQDASRICRHLTDLYPALADDALRVGAWVSVAGTTAAGPDGAPVGGDDIAEQTREAVRRIEAALEQVGAGLGDVVRTRMYVTDISRWEEVGRAHGEFFADVRPASSMVEVSALIDPRLLVGVEADAVLG